MTTNYFEEVKPTVEKFSQSNKTGSKTTADSFGKHSLETCFAQLTIKDLLKNMKKSMNNIFTRMTQEEGCMCQKDQGPYQQINFKPQTYHYALMKSNRVKNDKEMVSLNDCKFKIINF